MDFMGYVSFREGKEKHIPFWKFAIIQIPTIGIFGGLDDF